MPDYAIERRFAALIGDGGPMAAPPIAGLPIAGIDEAGRGPLAGPVVAAAAVLDWDRLPPSLRDEIDDSKALDRKRREAVFAALGALSEPGIVRIGVGIASVEEIDSINILQATFLAMRRAVAVLDPAPVLALVDGNRAPPLPCRAETIVGGDALCLSIAAASIAAKVTRDRIMADLALRHPGYGWERNAGYGTRAHCEALKRLGPTEHHRRSFAPVRRCLALLAVDDATRGTQDARPCPEPHPSTEPHPSSTRLLPQPRPSTGS